MRRIARLFKGRVDDIGAVYANAGCVLLPTVEGHGLSIKAVEALSCGAPLVATPLAFRGHAGRSARIEQCRARRERRAISRGSGARRRLAPTAARRRSHETSDTRRLYEESFSPQAYARTLGAAVAQLGVA